MTDTPAPKGAEAIARRPKPLDQMSQEELEDELERVGQIAPPHMRRASETVTDLEATIAAKDEEIARLRHLVEDVSRHHLAAESEVTRLKAELIDARNLIDTGHADVAAEKLRSAIRSEASKLPAAGETEEPTMSLPWKAWEWFLEEINAPREPNEALRKLFADYRNAAPPPSAAE